MPNLGRRAPTEQDLSRPPFKHEVQPLELNERMSDSAVASLAVSGAVPATGIVRQTHSIPDGPEQRRQHFEEPVHGHHEPQRLTPRQAGQR